MNEIRTVQRLRNGFIWEQIDFQDLQEGDIFRLFEPDGLLSLAIKEKRNLLQIAIHF
jgi:hypothetical protein